MGQSQPFSPGPEPRVFFFFSPLSTSQGDDHKVQIPRGRVRLAVSGWLSAKASVNIR